MFTEKEKKKYIQNVVFKLDNKTYTYKKSLFGSLHLMEETCTIYKYLVHKNIMLNFLLI